jgi:hypothetical protein
MLKAFRMRHLAGSLMAKLIVNLEWSEREFQYDIGGRILA